MCDPVSIGVAAVSTVAGYSSAKNQQDYNAAMAQHNANVQNKAALDSLHQGYTDAQYQLIDLDDQLSDQVEDNYLMTMKAHDTAKMQAASKGVQGNSVDNLLSDIRGQGAGNQHNLRQNAVKAKAQSMRELSTMQKNAANGMVSPDVYKPSSLSTALDAGMTGINNGMAVGNAMGQIKSANKNVGKQSSKS
ncbi:hypothetical protein [Endozoicomonas sp. SESOKO1]|uniref:virion core protein, T7 gp14 family n=1 Tax=Endozoicomonas sp. SESOKO1 TaxID=2828742 RepID=UPI0021499625|nr:hypothetical protein [Endozoicomonas sp. SESOKO1]